MAAQIWLDFSDQTLVVNKRFHRNGSTDAEQRHRSQHSWLRKAAGHPVTSLVTVDPGDLVITTAYAGGSTALSTARPPAEAARLLSAVARTLGSLHRSRMVHGNIAGDHIIVNGPRFVLCSPSGLADDPAGDVVAFGPLIELLCLRWEASPHHDRGPLGRWREVGLSASEPGLSASRLAARLSALAES